MYENKSLFHSKGIRYVPIILFVLHTLWTERKQKQNLQPVSFYVRVQMKTDLFLVQPVNDFNFVYTYGIISA